jgi:organic radical activating enzyme
MSLNAGNLTISVPYYGCNKNCPYCVSQMTGNFTNNTSLFYANLDKVKTVARSANIYNVLLTGKGEPLFGKSIYHTKQLLNFFKDYPTEIQTNGISLLENSDLCDELVINQLNVLVLSIDNVNDLENYKFVIKELKKSGVIIRVTLNLSKLTLNLSKLTWDDTTKFVNYIINTCLQYEIDQFTLRRLSVPYGCNDTDQARWIQENTSMPILIDVIDYLRFKMYNNGTFLRKLNYGPEVYDYQGLSVVTTDECIQENHNDNDLRSLIYLQDGHLYTHWGHKGSILF